MARRISRSRQTHSAVARTNGWTLDRSSSASDLPDAPASASSGYPSFVRAAWSTEVTLAVVTLGRMTSDTPAVHRTATRSRFWWVRWVLVAVVVVVLAVEIVLIWPKLEEAAHRIGDLDWVWLVACIVAALLSMDSFAQVQRALLRSAGVRVSEWKSLSVVLAANSVSQTLPGGQVLAPAFTYRETRKWGASPVVASWQVVMSGLLAGVGLAVLGFGGALLAGAKTSPFSVFFSAVGFCLLYTSPSPRDRG